MYHERTDDYWINYVRLGFYELRTHEILSKNFEWNCSLISVYKNNKRLIRTEEIGRGYFEK